VTAAKAKSSVKDAVVLFKDPVVKACIQLGILLLVRVLSDVPHPAARYGRGVLVALTVLIRAQDSREWFVEELVKLRTDLKKMARATADSPHIQVALTIIDKLLLNLRVKV